jgi:5-methylcytosine-specific restriction endonuclease McrA
MKKTCLCKPPKEIFDCLEKLNQATNLHISGDDFTARKLILEANSAEVREWTESLWGAKSPYVRPVKTKNPLPNLSKAEKAAFRMPDAALKKTLLQRDGFQCRVCGVPLIRKEVRVYFQSKYPELEIWGNRNALQHATFQATWLQYDHVVPHARGGDNTIQNMIITCAPCNYSRMNYTFEELELCDPREREPIKTGWSGCSSQLEGFAPKLQKINAPGSRRNPPPRRGPRASARRGTAPARPSPSRRNGGRARPYLRARGAS